MMQIYVNVVVPDTYHSDKIVAHSNKQVKNEKQEVSIVFQSKTVIDPS